MLDSLSKYQGRYILNNTVSISGVSGGGMGQGIYAAIKKRAIREKDKAIIRRVQDSLSTNFLSRDLSWLLGWDLIREYFSYGKTGNDRAKESLDEYADLVSDSAMNTVSYREYWAEMQTNGNYFPMLLTNTMGKNNVYGVSASVRFNDFTKVFPGYIDVLSNPKNQTVRYAICKQCQLLIASQ